MHVVPLRSADGTVTAILGVTRDVTEWKKTETRLRQSEDRYRRLLAVLPDAIPVSYTHLRAHETVLDLVCRLLPQKKKT